MRVIRSVVLIAIVSAIAIPAASAAATIEISITGTLEPSSVTVSSGTTVAWRNADGERHRMRSYAGPDEFDSGNLEQGEGFAVTLTIEGTYRYRDDRDRENSAYWGTIVVGASAGGSGSSGGASGGGSAPASRATVTIGDRIFTPATVTVGVNGSVTWVNRDDRAHTATAEDRSFDSGTRGAGASFTRRFPRAGTFRYLCLIHPDMRGTVRVQGAGGTVPAPAPATSTPARQTQPPRPGQTDVRIVDLAFEPATVSVAPGGTVRWTNAGAAVHTVTAEDDSFDSGLVNAGGSFSRRFTAEGVVRYLCAVHPQMRGVVEVSAAAAGAASPVPTPSPEPTPASGSRPDAVRRPVVIGQDYVFTDGGIVAVLFGVPIAMLLLILVWMRGGSDRRPPAR